MTASAEPDRLAHAKNYANELNDSRIWKIKISYQKRWTAHRRAQKAVEIQTTKPWLRSAGPKSAAGKARSSRNADKGRGWAKPDELTRALFSAMRDQRRFRQMVEQYCKRPDMPPEEERLWLGILSELGRIVTRRLMRAYIRLELAAGPENYYLLLMVTNVTQRNNE